MSNPVKPLPRPDETTKAYWASLAEGTLRLQWCKSCRRTIHYPRPHCPYCLSAETEFRPHSGQGTVHAFTIVHVHPDNAFAPDLPLVVAMIDLEGGGRLLSNVVDVEPSPDAVRVGMPVRLRCEKISDAVGLPRFVPADPSS